MTIKIFIYHGTSKTILDIYNSIGCRTSPRLIFHTRFREFKIVQDFSSGLVTIHPKFDPDLRLREKSC